MASIFSDSTILTTPALLRLGAVEYRVGMPSPRNFSDHKDMLLYRLRRLAKKSADAEGFDAMCDMVVDLLGPDALIECNSMTEQQVAEAILTSSAGIGLLNDLRENWKGTRGLQIIGASQDTDFFDTLTLREWLETLAAQYIDI